MVDKQWIQAQDNFMFSQIPVVHKALPPHIYELQFDPMRGEFFLQRVCESFELPDKVFDLEEALIERVIKTFKTHDKNFGLLLKGLKGTGKTIAAKIICNKLKLPVVLVTKPWKDMGHFINSINQDIVMLFDEFEKIYELWGFGNNQQLQDAHDNNITNLLTLMDGVFTSQHKRLFILTTNKEYLPEALSARPSRIRYVQDFSDLSYKAIMEILQDTVENKAFIPNIATFLKQLEFITVDIVKAIAEEVNLYKTDDPELFKIFNIKLMSNHYDIYQVRRNKKEVLVFEDQELPIQTFRPHAYFYADEGREELGNIISNDPKTGIIVCTDPDDGTKRITYHYKKSAKMNHRAFMGPYIDI